LVPIHWGVDQFHHGKNVQIHSKSSETKENYDVFWFDDTNNQRFKRRVKLDKNEQGGNVDILASSKWDI